MSIKVTKLDRRDFVRCVSKETRALDSLVDDFTDGGDVFIVNKDIVGKINFTTGIIEDVFAENVGIIDDLLDLRDEMGEIINNLEYKLSEKDDEVLALEIQICNLERKLREYE